MKNNWSRVPLGELLKKSDRWIRVQPNESYKLVTVRLWGKGVVLRGQVTGAEIAASEMLQVQPDQFILSRIDARNGAFGLIPVSLDGGVVSNDFPVFDINKTRLLPTFLGWMSKTGDFVDFCKAASEGTTNRVRLKEDRFLATAIPLPPLGEQRWIAAKIDEIASKVEEARRLRHQATEEGKAIQRALADVVLRDIKTRIQLGEGLFDLIYRYPTFYNIVFTDKGVGLLKISNLTQEGWKIQFDNPRDFISQETNQRFQRTIVEAGDLVMAARGATIGKTAYVTEEFAGFNINANLLRLKPNAAKLEGKYFWYFMCSNLAQNQFQALVTSTAKQTITVPKLKSIYIPLPPVTEQYRIVAYLDGFAEKVEALKGQQKGTTAEIDAFLPSILDKAFKGEL